MESHYGRVLSGEVLAAWTEHFELQGGLEAAYMRVVLFIALTLAAGVIFSVMSLILLATELNADEE